MLFGKYTFQSAAELKRSFSVSEEYDGSSVVGVAADVEFLSYATGYDSSTTNYGWLRYEGPRPFRRVSYCWSVSDDLPPPRTEDLTESLNGH